LDVEHLVQALQLRHAAAQPGVLGPNTQNAIAALGAAGALADAEATELGDQYRFLRRVESGVRLLDTSARHDLPSDGQQLARLAYLLGHSSPDRLRQQCRDAMSANRDIFDRLAISKNYEPPSVEG
jgi:glutamate-ammonia-ligase adenylyltransferase